MASGLPEIQHAYTFIVKILFGEKRANYVERGQKEQADCLKGRALQERKRIMLCGIISSPYTSQARVFLFYSQQIPHQWQKFRIFKRANTRNHVILGADKQVPELHHLLNRKPSPTTKHPDAVTLAGDAHCKLCTASQASEMFDSRIQVGSIA